MLHDFVLCFNLYQSSYPSGITTLFWDTGGKVKFEISETPSDEEINEIRFRLQNHNEPFWEVENRYKYLITLTEESTLIGGMVFTIFGEWLEIDFFWIDDLQRGKGYGSQILYRGEEYARLKGCKKSFLNTFNFQAPSFYKKNGYRIVYTQNNFPVRNTRYFMEKNL